jgi:hypothetical protein
LDAPGIDTYHVHTYPVYVNITLSIDDEVVARARSVARARGLSLQQLIREYLESVAGRAQRLRALDGLERAWAKGPLGVSEGPGPSRADLYAERLDRYPSR